MGYSYVSQVLSAEQEFQRQKAFNQKQYMYMPCLQIATF